MKTPFIRAVACAFPFSVFSPTTFASLTVSSVLSSSDVGHVTLLF